MKIFIDFDDVIFNTNKFKDDLIKIFLDNGVSEEEFKDHYYNYPPNTDGDARLKTYFFERHIKVLGENIDIDEDKLKKDVSDFFSDTSSYVFPDAIDFLNSFEKNDLCIVSFGGRELLEMKIGNSGVTNLVRDVILTEELKESAIGDSIRREKIKRYEDKFFLDDRMDQIKSVKEKFPEIKTILIKRPEGRYDDKPGDCCDFVAKDLREADKIINGNS
ncbi:MAG: hypothetical protein PHH24_04210 [Candidatus Moranbacteria bacterium]|jgi:FMN phosphatase YigB (HAD superfamily)|nr:hypothetical protein [Candidatus Moranbacteria bacterium]MDD5652512.1 hypothetical protein [Candidatus Moranbacteria bacterium]MDX9855426.1 hypothetical protein [Candidatus Moranbacteria bacterium]